MIYSYTLCELCVNNFKIIWVTCIRSKWIRLIMNKISGCKRKQLMHIIQLYNKQNNCYQFFRTIFNLEFLFNYTKHIMWPYIPLINC